MDVRVLGNLELSRDGDTLPIGGPRQRRLLIRLVIARGSVVSIDSLADAVWGDGEPPRSYRRTIMSYVSRLRGVIGTELILQAHGGYRLDVTQLDIDLAEVETLADRGRQLLNCGEIEEAESALDSALDLWQGQPFIEFGDEAWLVGQRQRWEDLHLDIVEDRLEVSLRRGDHQPSQLVELELLAGTHLGRERLQLLRIESMYRAGRQQEALSALQDVRQAAVDRGLTLAPELVELERRVLEHDDHRQSLAPPMQEAIGSYRIGRQVRDDEHSVHVEGTAPGGSVPVAVRIFRPHIADSRDLVARFDLEAARVARLDHPHIVPVLDHWRSPGAAFVVTRYVQGRRLDEITTRELDTTTLVTIVDRLCRALEAVHAQGISHGNVRPASILLADDGEVWLTDFTIGLGAPILTDRNGFDSSSTTRSHRSTETDIEGVVHVVHTLFAGHPSEAEVMAGVERMLQRDGPRTDLGDLADEIARCAGTNAPGRRSDQPATNPYRGLRPFTEADSNVFFGRRELVEELRARVSRSSLVVIVGPSGSGKSSLARAGLLPLAPELGLLPASMIPGAEPCKRLDDALGALATAERRPSGEVLLLIDQFEELYTHSSAGQRERFTDFLIQAASPRSGYRIVLTVRADLLDRPLRDPRIGPLLQDAVVHVVPLDDEQLVEAVVEPASAVGLDIEPALLGRIVHDVRRSPGGLPLLQFALTELVERRTSRQLTLQSYEEIGGVAGALTARAEWIYQTSDEQDQEAIRRLFARLVTLGEGTPDTRRRIHRSELPAVPDVVIDRFVDHRLVTMDRDQTSREPTIEVAHEAMIASWLRLSEWLDEDRDGLRLQRHISRSAQEWERSGRDGSELYRGARLEAALAYTRGHTADLTPSERTFLDAARALRDAEHGAADERRRQRERQHRRLRAALGGISALAVLAFLTTALAWQQRQAANDEAAVSAESRAAAETRRMVSDTAQLGESGARIGLLVAAEAYARQPDAASIGALRQILTASRDLIGYVGQGRPTTDVTWLNEDQLAAIDRSGVRVVNLDGEVIREIPLPLATRIAADPSGERLAVATSERTVHVIDARTGIALTAPQTIAGSIQVLAWDAEGATLAIGDRLGEVTLVSADGARRLAAHDDVDPLSVGEGEVPPAPHEPQSFAEGVTGLAFSADGSLLLSGGGRDVRLWNLDDLSLAQQDRMTDLTGRLATVTGVGFVNRSGRTLVGAASASAVSLWDPDSGTLVDSVTLSDAVTFAVSVRVDVDTSWKPEATAVVLSDGRLRIFESGFELRVLDTEFGGPLSVELSPDARMVAIAGSEGIVVLSRDGRGALSQTVGDHRHDEYYVSSDGRSVVGSDLQLGADPTWWRLEQDRWVERSIPDPMPDYVWIGLRDGTAASLDFERGEFFIRDEDTLEPISAPIETANAFTIDVDLPRGLVALARVDDDQRPLVQVNSIASGEVVAHLTDLTDEPDASARVAKFTEDGERLLVATDDGRAQFYDTTTWEPIEPVISQGNGQVIDVGFSKDGQLFATVSIDGVTTIRNTTTLQPVGGRILGNHDAVEGFSLGPHFTEDGRWLVTNSDGSVRVIDLEERRIAGPPLPHSGSGLGQPSHNARWGVTTIGDDVVRWDLDIDGLFERACRMAGRNMTADEWQQFGPAGEPLRVTCPQWPLGA